MIKDKMSMMGSLPKKGWKGASPYLRAGAASGLSAGLILAYAESLYLLFTVGNFEVDLVFLGKALCLYGLLGSVLGFLLSAVSFRFLRVRRRPPERIRAAYFALFLGAGVAAEILFYLMDIYPFGGTHKYSFRTLALLAAGIIVSAVLARAAYILSARGAVQRQERRRPGWRGAILLLSLGLVSFVAVEQLKIGSEKKAVLAAHTSQGNARPNVLFILVDSLRSDHLSCNGYPLPTSPHLDALAAQGILIKSMLATSTWTIPTHASLFTGLYPSSHGAYSLFSTLDSRLPTLPRLLSKQGYYSLSLYSNPFLSSVSGLNSGFHCALGIEHDQKTSLTLVRFYRKFIRRAPPSQDIMTLAQKWAAYSRRLGAPYFIFMNVFDVHFPFVAHEPYFSDFSKSLTNNAMNLSLIHRLAAFKGSRKERLSLLAKLKDPELAYLARLYDSGVRYEDECIGKMMRNMRDQGLLANTLVVITSDHGEFLGEHAMMGHLTAMLYQPILEIPFILWYPEELRPRLITRSVSQVDVFPTLLSVLGLKSQTPPGIQGVDMLSASASSEVLCEFWDDVNQSFARALYDGPWKIISPPDANPELYDLGPDPRESVNLAALRPDKVRELSDKLMARVRSLNPRSPRIDERKKKEMTELLKSLSYIDH